MTFFDSDRVRAVHTDKWGRTEGLVEVALMNWEEVNKQFFAQLLLYLFFRNKRLMHVLVLVNQRDS